MPNSAVLSMQRLNDALNARAATNISIPLPALKPLGKNSFIVGML